jgi:phage gpG-like protein
VPIAKRRNPATYLAELIMELFNLLTAAARFEAAARDMHFVGEGILTELAVKIRDRAKAAIGTYTYHWPELADSTIARKGGRDEPLLDTSELRSSIEATIHAHEKKAWVGSNLDKAVWHELGTSKAPPRSFLMMSAMEAEHKDLPRIARKYVAAAFAGRGAYSSELRHFLEAVKLLLHVAKELVHTVKKMQR